MIEIQFKALGLGGQQYPRGYSGYSVNPYAGSYGGVGGVALDPVYSNGFGSEYGSRYGAILKWKCAIRSRLLHQFYHHFEYYRYSGSSYSSLNSPYYNRYGGNNYGYPGGLGGGFGNTYGGGGGFQY